MSLKNVLEGDRSVYEIIPLGVDCEISHFTRANGLRLTAFPFDWNVTPIMSAIELLHNGFADYLRPDNLVFLPPVDRLLFDENGAELQINNDIITPAVCARYRILFPHDFSRAGRQDLGTVQSKYRRRIERVTQLLNSNIHLVFVAHYRDLNDWQKAQYQAALGAPFSNPHRHWEAELARVLDEKFPDLSYTVCDLQSFKLQATAALKF
jgi:hypothetical protein